MAAADTVYVDPGALLKLYVHEPESVAMNAWRARTQGALIVTHHGRAEVINGICLAAFRKLITAEALGDALASFEEDFAEGRYVKADLLWRATLRRTEQLSLAFTQTLGCRTVDVLHVASAVELQLKHFVTFDRRQQQLARDAGLKLIGPAA